MKHLTRRLLPLVLTLLAALALMTTALAADTDTLVIKASPNAGIVDTSGVLPTTFIVIPDVLNEKDQNVSDNYEFSFLWTLNETTVSTTDYYLLTLDKSVNAYVLTCTVTATHKTSDTKKTTTVVWYPASQNEGNISLTIGQNLGTYYFDDTSTETGDSVYSQLIDLLDLPSSADYDDYTVTFISSDSYVAAFGSMSTCALDEVPDVYLTIGSSGTWVTHYSVMRDNTAILSGTLTIKVEPYIGLDAYLYAEPGETAVISYDTFYEIWADHGYDPGDLDKILITGCSGLSGSFYYDYSASDKRHTGAYGITMYASPTGTQKSIADLAFVPTKTAGKYPSDTLTVSFQASGTTSDKKALSLSGNIMVFYTTKTPADINYLCTGTHVSFERSDFDTVYRNITGTTAKNPVYSIRFLDLPAYGTLYRNYNGDNYGVLDGFALTEQNISVLTFSNISSGENSLSKLAYVPWMHSSSVDSAHYVVYSGTKILYVGTVNFTSQELVLTFTASDSTFRFSSTDFYGGMSPLLEAPYILFGTPSSGTLYKDYANDTRVQPRDYFSYNTDYGMNLIDNVVFVPKDNFSGLVEIPFTGNSLLGGSISGKIQIYVVRDVFDDVDPNNWAAPYINRLYAAGIIGGTSATTFSPNDNMNYGAALKMILVAAGYPKQSETGGTHWASAYLDLAYREGIVSSRSIDLNAAVDRNTIAEIAAKALGLQKATSVSSGIIAPVDSNNGYVYALYNAGILNGSFVGGFNYFHGSNNITRAEVAKIICAISDYSK